MGGAGFPAVDGEVIAPQRVDHDQDHALGGPPDVDEERDRSDDRACAHQTQRDPPADKTRSFGQGESTAKESSSPGGVA
jgi:hypothetical protein